MARIILETEDSVKNYIQKYASKRNWTMSTVLREVINDWIKKSKPVGRKRASINGSTGRGERAK